MRSKSHASAPPKVPNEKISDQKPRCIAQFVLLMSLVQVHRFQLHPLSHVLTEGVT